MTQENWIDIKEAMPGINKKVEIMYDDGEIVESVFSLNTTFEPRDGKFIFVVAGSFLANMSKVKKWRYPAEKRPDFSKLKIGDLIVIEYSDMKELYTVFFTRIFEDEKIGASLGNQGNRVYMDLYIYKISKITRINLEEKTFEDI